VSSGLRWVAALTMSARACLSFFFSSLSFVFFFLEESTREAGLHNISCYFVFLSCFFIVVHKPCGTVSLCISLC
jgi:hypothetical protein